MSEVQPLSAAEIVEKSKRYTLYDWQAQSKASPIAVDRAEGVYFWDVDDTRYLDFNSQLMGVNIGHGDKRVADAIARQAEKLPYISPFMAYETRARLGEKLAALWPGDLEKSFFTLGGAEANENAIRIAKAFTGRQKILARYRSYHGATYATINLTGDPPLGEREPTDARDRARPRSVPGHRTRHRGCGDGPRDIGGDDRARGTPDDRGVHPRDGHGDERDPIPPDGYLEGVRDLCDRYGILFIADEIMCGFDGPASGSP